LRMLAAGETLDVPLQAIFPHGVLADVQFALAAENPAGLTLGAVNPSSGKATLHWQPDVNAEPGLYFINLQLTDSDDPELTSRAVVQVLFASDNQPPDLDAVQNQLVKAGETLTFQLHGHDPDGSALDLRYGLDTDAPSGAFVDPFSGIFDWTPT